MGIGELAGVFLVLAAISGCHSTDAEDEVQAARDHERQGHDEDVLALSSHLLGPPYTGKIGGDARQMMARVYLKRHRFCLARLFYEEALAHHRTASDHAGAHTDAQELADALRDRFDFEAALGLAAVSRDEAARARDSTLESRSLRVLARIYHEIGDSAQALVTYQDALDKLSPDDRSDRALELILRGALLSRLHRYSLARQDLEEALALATRLDDFKLVRDAEVNLNDIDQGHRDLESARAHLDRAQAAWDRSGERHPSAGILVNRAYLDQVRGDFEGAIRALDELSAADPPPDAETASQIAQMRGSIYEDAHDDKRAEEAFRQATNIVEEMWSTNPMASFLEDRWSPYQSLFALQIKRDALRDAFETVIRAQGRMFLAKAIGTNSSSAPTGCQDRLRSPRDMVGSSPLAQTLGPTETLEALRGRRVLNYFVGADHMRLLMIDDGLISLASVDVDVNELGRLVTEFLTAPDGGAAERLGKLLLPPDVITAAPRRFYVIPAGPLLRLSFAALVVDGRRIVSRHDIVYAPSATGLAHLATSAAGPTSTPVLLDDARNNLRHSAEEANTVVSSVNAIRKSGRDATIAAFRAAANTALLHVIGHSGVDNDGGYLLLADGQATAADILRWGIRPRLAILPTCASAATSKHDMWGSLAVAFLAAGSADVVATLFSVEDAAAVAFTKAFYKHQGVVDPVSAVAAAQREMMASNHRTSVWSAFIAVGL